MYHQTTLVLKDHDGYHFIPYNAIIRCEAKGNYSLVITIDGKQLLTSKTLKYIEQKLPKAQFIRIHQSHVIAISAIRSIDTSNMIHLSDDSESTLFSPYEKQSFVITTYQIIMSSLSKYLDSGIFSKCPPAYYM